MNKIIIIIICVLLVGVGFFVYTAKNQNKSDPEVLQNLTPEEKESVIESLSAPATSTQNKKVDTKILESLSAPEKTTSLAPSDEEQRKILESLQAK